MLTGYEQVRSVAAAIAGDIVRPTTCISSCPKPALRSTAVDVETEAVGCCGGPAAESGRCCVADSVAKDEGKAGCGCQVAA